MNDEQFRLYLTETTKYFDIDSEKYFEDMYNDELEDKQFTADDTYVVRNFSQRRIL